MKPTDALIIRECSPSDAALLARLYRGCFPDHFRSLLGESVCRCYFESLLSHKAYKVFCAADGQTLLGFVVLHSSDGGSISKSWMIRSWRNVLFALLRMPIRLARHAGGKLWNAVSTLRKPRAVKPILNSCRSAYVDFLGVSAESRGLGIGLQLLKRCLQYAIESSTQRIRLTVCQNNSSAISLYKRFGFKQRAYHPQHGSYSFDLVLDENVQ